MEQILGKRLKVQFWSFEHVDFEMFIRQLSGNVQALGYMGLKFRRKVLTGGFSMGINSLMDGV